MSIATIIICILLAFVAAGLLVGEIFLAPGFGLAGILGAATIIGVELYLVTAGFTSMAIWFALIALAAFCLFAFILSRKKVVKQVALRSEIDATARKAPEGIVVGATGVSHSRLALKGTVKIDGKIFEATSEQGFIDEEMPIFVSRIEGGTIYVSLDRREV